MKAKVLLFNLIVVAFVVQAQTFKKGTLLIGISEGSTWARYTTSDFYTKQVINDEIVKGDRDPLQIEYGISHKWGIAVSFGNDIFKIKPKESYHYNYSDVMKSKTRESVVEINYHFYTQHKWDLAVFGGLGSFKVELFDNNSKCLKDAKISYDKGGIVRYGLKARYYVFNRFSVLGMLSMFGAASHSGQLKSNTDVPVQRIETRVSGITLEFGLSYKIIK